MRLFVAAENEAFLLCLRQMFKHTRVRTDSYPVTTCSHSHKVFKALHPGKRVCLVKPGETEVRLRLTEEDNKFVLHCPAFSDCNTHGLTKAVLTMLAGEGMDVVVLPMLGYDSLYTARGMCRAMADVLAH